ncbi:MAG: hypothetical protein ACI9I4_002113 [Neolewinella sp.]
MRLNIGKLTSLLLFPSVESFKGRYKEVSIGVTSARNKAFFDSVACCDQIIRYGEETPIDNTLATAYVDMSGGMKLTTALHHHLGANMVESGMVGASHWENGGDVGELPGAKPSFFFALSQIAKRDEEWP